MLSPKRGYGARIGFVLAGCLLAVMVLCTLGCGSGGPAMGQVSGKVTLDGQPLANATIEFRPREGRPSGATTDASGDYTLQFTAHKTGVLIGEHTVKITTEGEIEDPETGETTEVPERVPAKYNAETTLTATVSGGKNTINFELTSE